MPYFLGGWLWGGTLRFSWWLPRWLVSEGYVLVESSSFGVAASADAKWVGWISWNLESWISHKPGNSLRPVWETSNYWMKRSLWITWNKSPKWISERKNKHRTAFRILADYFCTQIPDWYPLHIHFPNNTQKSCPLETTHYLLHDK